MKAEALSSKRARSRPPSGIVYSRRCRRNWYGSEEVDTFQRSGARGGAAIIVGNLNAAARRASASFNISGKNPDSP